MARKTVIAALLTALAAPAAGAPLFSLPVDCVLGETCYIQQYMDLDPSSAAQDYTCGPLSYDGHKGTDFALATIAEAKAGVIVRPAAPGTVLGVRDGMDDVWSGDIDANAIKGRDCGNGLVIDHGGGWHTQYCHLMNGSVAVKKGDRVSLSAQLGQIGMSGRTQFPHMHLSVRKDGAPVDPFAPDGAASCEKVRAETLWSDLPVYQPGAVLSMSFSNAVPEYAEVKAGTASKMLTPTSPSIIAYSFVFGGRESDVLRQTLIGPDNFSVSDDFLVTRNRAQFYRAIGKGRRSNPWPSGTYTAQAQLIRDGEVISEKIISVDITR